MFTASLPDCRKISYLWFSTNTQIGGQMLQDLILRTRLCSTGFFTQYGWVVHFRLTKMVRRKCFVPVRYQLPRGILAGRAQNIFAWFIGAGRVAQWLSIMFLSFLQVVSSAQWEGSCRDGTTRQREVREGEDVNMGVCCIDGVGVGVLTCWNIDTISVSGGGSVSCDISCGRENSRE